ncbi:MAG: T9SS type A sorting domain-containing protein [Saprospiraceae bacterium]
MDDNNDFNLNKVKKKGLQDQFFCVNADHILHSDYSKRIVEFFNRHVEITNVNTAIRSKDNIVVSPNPFTESAIIEFDNSLIGGNLSIININGTVVQNIEMGNPSPYILRRGNMVKGIYYILIEKGNFRQNYSFVIQ